MTSIDMFCYKEKMFILMNILMIGKILMEKNYLKKKNIMVT